MEASTATPAAPAQPAADAPAPTQTAVEHAATTGNFREFRAARRAERTGNPLPAVPVATEAASVDADPPAPVVGEKPAEKGLSKRQQDINDRAQRAVDSATTTLREENARLKAQLATVAPAAPIVTEPTKPAAPVAAKFPTLAEYSTAHPEASLEDYLEARDDWRESKTKTDTAARTQADELTAAQQQRSEQFVKQLHDARAADPAFVSKLSEDVLHRVKPFSALKPGEQAGPMNVIGEQVHDSPIAPAVLLHLSQPPEALTALTTMPAHIAALPRGAQANAHIQYIIREFGKLEGRLATAAEPRPIPAKTLTDAPAMDTLGTRPAEAADPVMSAVRTGNFKQFRAAKRARMTANKG